jgi:cell wall-associated NlpC family hydrolase
MRKQLISSIIAASLVMSSVPGISAPITAEASSVLMRGEIVSGVNFRTAPSTSSGKIIRMLKKGETVDIIEVTNAYWYKVKDRNGRIGYVSSSPTYIRTNTSTSNSLTKGEVIYGVNFRTAPSTSSGKIIRMLKKGETVDIIEKTNANWYKVKDRNGQTGYVSSSSKYIRLVGRNVDNLPSAGNKNSNSGNNNSVVKGDASELAAKVIKAGMKYLGTPYEYGSDRNSTATFDCSAFVRRAFLDGIGLTLPPDSRQQGEYVKKKGKTTTNWRNLKAGDLMFFMSYRGPKKSDYSGINKSKQTINHVGIYLGDGRILHTYSKESGGVRIDSIAGKHWEYRFLFGGSAF